MVSILAIALALVLMFCWLGISGRMAAKWAGAGIVLSVTPALAVAVLLLPTGDYTVLYRCVLDHDEIGPPHDRILMDESPSVKGIGFLIKDDKLYLETQRTRLSRLIVTYVSSKEWTDREISEFRSKHPELEKYWPDPKKPNGGVLWLERCAAVREK